MLWTGNLLNDCKFSTNDLKGQMDYRQPLLHQPSGLRDSVVPCSVYSCSVVWVRQPTQWAFSELATHSLVEGRVCLCLAGRTQAGAGGWLGRCVHCHSEGRVDQLKWQPIPFCLFQLHWALLWWQIALFVGWCVLCVSCGDRWCVLCVQEVR